MVIEVMPRAMRELDNGVAAMSLALLNFGGG